MYADEMGLYDELQADSLLPPSERRYKVVFHNEYVNGKVQSTAYFVKKEGVK